MSLILAELTLRKGLTLRIRIPEDIVETEERLKKLEKLLQQLKDKDSWIFVEGQRDKRALGELGLDIKRILTISGNLLLSCGQLEGQLERRPERRNAEKVFVLTDLDRRGNELALRARDELQSRSLTADLTLRQNLAHLLKIKNFEDAKRAYDKIKEENTTKI